jgi:hypothetical protein
MLMVDSRDDLAILETFQASPPPARGAGFDAVVCALRIWLGGKRRME